MSKCTAMLQKLLNKRVRENIPKGLRKNYLPDQSAESKKLFKEYTIH